MLRRCLVLAFLFAAASPLALPSAAHACGALFCDRALPVNQAAEQVIFARHADGTVTAIVLIQYSGPAERFAWLLPVSGTPEVDVSSTQLFARLAQTTQPSYAISRFDQEGTCRDQVPVPPCPGADLGVRDQGIFGVFDAAPANFDGGPSPAPARPSPSSTPATSAPTTTPRSPCPTPWRIRRPRPRPGSRTTATT